MTKAADFNQQEYWIQRHKRLKGDPRSVGNLGKSLEQNLSAEKRMQHWVACAARLLKPYSSVLDVGCGYGRVASVFCGEGYKYTGIDVSPVAIEAARKIEPRGYYVVGSALDVDFYGKFDLICVLYVFVHFVEDKDWRQLISKLASMLNGGGALLVADDFPEAKIRPVPHVAQRPLFEYEPIFETHGLAFDPSFRKALATALGTDKIPPAYLARRAG